MRRTSRPLRDGIGGWSDLDFVNAVMRGVSPEGAHYYPAFPYTSYQHMTVEDALDLKAFIDTLPPVAGRAPGHDLPLLFQFRRGIGLWKDRYMGAFPSPLESAADPLVQRGSYLVTGPGHCGECHTPRDALGGPIPERAYSGGEAPEGDRANQVPNITPSKDGIGDWSVDDIAAALRTGILPDFETFGGAMVHVQENMAQLGDEDRRAIAPLPQIAPAPARRAARAVSAGSAPPRLKSQQDSRFRGNDARDGTDRSARRVRARTHPRGLRRRRPSAGSAGPAARRSARRSAPRPCADCRRRTRTTGRSRP